MNYARKIICENVITVYLSSEDNDETNSLFLQSLNDFSLPYITAIRGLVFVYERYYWFFIRRMKS